MERKSIKKSQGGFTLIEIIAVLVILGILAAVAIPRFVGLQDEAKKKSAEAAVGAAQSAISMAYAVHLLDPDNAVTGPQAACVNVALNAPTGVTYTVTCTGEDWDVASSAITGTYDAQTATGTWTNPSLQVQE